jgi:hypothetical protein
VRASISPSDVTSFATRANLLSSLPILILESGHTGGAEVRFRFKGCYRFQVSVSDLRILTGMLSDRRRYPPTRIRSCTRRVDPTVRASAVSILGLDFRQDGRQHR